MMKPLLTALSILTLAISTGGLNNILHTTLQKSNISTNAIDTKTQQDTKYIDIYGKEVTTSKTDLSNIISKEVTQIGFYQNEYQQIQAVRMPRTIKKVPNQLPSEITSLNFMFLGAEKFNQNLSKWDVSRVMSMGGMFTGCFTFNQDISKWVVSNVQDMIGTFANTLSFNQDLSKWDVSNVLIMTATFAGALKFDQDLSSWNVKKVLQHIHFAIGSSIHDFYKLPKFKN